MQLFPHDGSEDADEDEDGEEEEADVLLKHIVTKKMVNELPNGDLTVPVLDRYLTDSKYKGVTDSMDMETYLEQLYNAKVSDGGPAWKALKGKGNGGGAGGGGGSSTLDGLAAILREQEERKAAAKVAAKAAAVAGNLAGWYGQVQVADYRTKERRYRQNALSPEIVEAIQTADDGDDFFEFLNEHWHTAKQQLVKTSLEKAFNGIDYLLEYTNPLNKQKTAILSMSDLKTFLKQIEQFREGPCLRIVEDDDD